MKTTQVMMMALAALASTAMAKGGQGGAGGNTGGNTGGNANAGGNTNTGGNTANAGGNNNAGAAAAAANTTSTSDATSSSSSSSSSGGNALVLLSGNVQTGSQSAGNLSVAGTAASDTDNANFINFCSGKTLTNGLQVTAGSCNGIVMGDIPSNQNMISSMLIFPAPGQDIDANTPFSVTVQTQNLVAGSFTDATHTYYSAPQALEGGNIVGHTHVSIQDLGNSLAPTTPPDPATFAFFKGINDNGNGQGLLAANVTAGLPAGFYRVCTMTSASNHQPVLMPVAQRGPQDDCQKFTVGQGSSGSGSTSTSGSTGGGNAKAVSAGGSNAASASSASAAATASASTASTSSASSTGGKGGNTGAQGGNAGAQGGGAQGGKGGRGRYHRERFAARDIIV